MYSKYYCDIFLNSVLSRTEDETCTLEDVSQLQTDIETLLANAGKRLKLLEGEIQLLINWQDKKDKKGVVTVSVKRRSCVLSVTMSVKKTVLRVVCYSEC